MNFWVEQAKNQQFYMVMSGKPSTMAVCLAEFRDKSSADRLCAMWQSCSAAEQGRLITMVATVARSLYNASFLTRM